ncbi:MAG: tRNA-dihydrouridine synthase [Clostridia bacterium]|nr:tRNA-dihydrouridine synthase [Clostridia bacterium]
MRADKIGNASEPLFLLAPMDGMTRASFRSVCFDYGADGATTEMIQSLALGRAKKRMSDTFWETLARYPNERNLAAQLIGSDPAMMAEAARRLTALERFDAIDINMGCPARKVVGSGNGSALLKTPEQALAVMAAVRRATSLPVQLKLRLGWDADSITAPILIRAAAEMGFRSVTLHGRTRSQMYAGPVDTRAIRATCESVRIPIYANGGVTCAADALSFLRDTGAAGVAIGRAALRQPWIFDDIRRLRRGEPIPERTAVERVALLKRLAKLACGHRPERVAVSEMRKFCGWMLPGLSDAEAVLSRLNSIVALEDFNRLMDSYLEWLARRDDLHIHSELMPEPTLDTVRPHR